MRRRHSMKLGMAVAWLLAGLFWLSAGGCSLFGGKIAQRPADEASSQQQTESGSAAEQTAGNRADQQGIANIGQVTGLDASRQVSSWKNQDLNIYTVALLAIFVCAVITQSVFNDWLQYRLQRLRVIGTYSGSGPKGLKLENGETL